MKAAWLDEETERVSSPFEATDDPSCKTRVQRVVALERLSYWDAAPPPARGSEGEPGDLEVAPTVITQSPLDRESERPRAPQEGPRAVEQPPTIVMALPEPPAAENDEPATSPPSSAEVGARESVVRAIDPPTQGDTAPRAALVLTAAGSKLSPLRALVAARRVVVALVCVGICGVGLAAFAASWPRGETTPEERAPIERSASAESSAAVQPELGTGSVAPVAPDAVVLAEASAVVVQEPVVLAPEAHDDVAPAEAAAVVAQEPVMLEPATQDAELPAVDVELAVAATALLEGRLADAAVAYAVLARLHPERPELATVATVLTRRADSVGGGSR